MFNLNNNSNNQDIGITIIENYKNYYALSLMYTRIQFALELQNKISNKENRIEIGCWAYEVYSDCNDVNDTDFLKLLTAISTMELGSEFFFSYEELNEIVKDLLSNKPINLNKFYR